MLESRVRWAGLVGIVAATVVAPPLNGQGVDVRNVGHLQGNPFAPVQVVEFADYGCSACGLFHRETKPRIVEEWIETGRLGWRLIPIRISDFRHSERALVAAECAAEQDLLWQLEQVLYNRQREWQGQRTPDRRLRAYVEQIGGDAEQWEACYRSSRREDSTELHNRIARQLGIRGTPTFFINGQRVRGALSCSQFSSLLEEAEAGAFR